MHKIKTIKINNQKFARIKYTNFGSHEPIETWYPVENLRWLNKKCDFKFSGIC